MKKIVFTMSETETEVLYPRKIYFTYLTNIDELRLSYEEESLGQWYYIESSEITGEIFDVWILYHDVFGVCGVFDTLEKTEECRTQSMNENKMHSFYDFHIFRPKMNHIL